MVVVDVVLIIQRVKFVSTKDYFLIQERDLPRHRFKNCFGHYKHDNRNNLFFKKTNKRPRFIDFL